uniref:OJ991214_12.13 protein n=1 Tax=Solanum tuberosum TaxID=4113 RepID=M1BQD3_SOLTU
MCSCTSKVCGLAAMLLGFFRNVGWFMLDPPKECLLTPLRCDMVVYAARPLQSCCRVHFGFPKVVRNKFEESE